MGAAFMAEPLVEVPKFLPEFAGAILAENLE